MLIALPLIMAAGSAGSDALALFLAFAGGGAGGYYLHQQLQKNPPTIEADPEFIAALEEKSSQITLQTQDWQINTKQQLHQLHELSQNQTEQIKHDNSCYHHQLEKLENKKIALDAVVESWDNNSHLQQSQLTSITQELIQTKDQFACVVQQLQTTKQLLSEKESRLETALLALSKLQLQHSDMAKLHKIIAIYEGVNQEYRTQITDLRDKNRQLLHTLYSGMDLDVTPTKTQPVQMGLFR